VFYVGANTKATKAMARYLACLVYRMMTKGQSWIDRGKEHFEAKCREREIKALHRKAAALGATVVFQE
jgi:transposase